MINYYTLLGINESAAPSEIKAAFKKMALRYHPDKHRGDKKMEELFKEVNQAYQILSNPYEKARYDIQLKFGHISPPQAPPPTYRPPRPRRPGYYEYEIDWKENWKATGYAFAFTFILAAIIMSGISIRGYLRSIEMEKQLIERRERYNKARDEYKLGNLDVALYTLNSLGTFKDSEADIMAYKRKLHESCVFLGEYSFNTGNMDDAIYYFELIDQYIDNRPLLLKENLATAYIKTNQPYKALKTLKELLIESYKSLETYILMAEIHRDLLNNHEEALRYFELANEKAMQRYQATYGDAYPLILTGEILPPLHYRLYTGLAKSYLEMDAFQKALKASLWNINTWPDSTANYIIAAKSYEALHLDQKACESLLAAKGLGYQGETSIVCP